MRRASWDRVPGVVLPQTTAPAGRARSDGQWAAPMEHRCRQGSTDGTLVSLRSRPAAGEGRAAVASGPDGACGVRLARARREANVAVP
jgi:hypothetical protein